MQLDIRSPGTAIVVRARQGSLNEPWLRAPSVLPCPPQGDDPRANRKQPVRRPSDARTWWNRIAAAISLAMRRAITDFAFATACMYPELLWPVLEQVNQRDSTEAAPPGRRADLIPIAHRAARRS
jgi:hypothetical protein